MFALQLFPPLIIFGWSTVCRGESIPLPDFNDWLRYTRNDLPEHDCSSGVDRKYGNPYFPNRWYQCSLKAGVAIYAWEEACPPGECFNQTSTQCDKPSCRGKFFPPDKERNCNIRRAEGPFIHPTDRTRYFRCQLLPATLGWDFAYEKRCQYGGIATANSTKDCCKPLSNCTYVADYLAKWTESNLFAQSNKPPIPDIPADYTFWDDMLVPREDLARPRNAVPNAYRLWPSGRIPYYIDESLDHMLPSIQTAMMDFHNRTCIRFIPWTPSNLDYVHLFSGNECYSFVGMQHTGGQQLSLRLSESCRPSVGVIIHELNHAVGFYHEHTRSDRDDYLDILWDNITPGQESNWDKLQSFGNIIFDNFTTETIMIYSSTSGSKDGVIPTMLDKSGKELPNIELSTSMSPADARRINALYNCPDQE